MRDIVPGHMLRRTVSYPVLREKQQFLVRESEQENRNFHKREQGMKELETISDRGAFRGKPFELSTYGFPLEMTKELLEEQGYRLMRRILQKFKQHQDLSRTASAGKFKGGLADTNEKRRSGFTATHLMPDFGSFLGVMCIRRGRILPKSELVSTTYPTKVSREVLDRVEAYVNAAIQSGVVGTDIMEKEAARAAASKKLLGQIPGESNGVSREKRGWHVYSSELCGCPHKHYRRHGSLSYCKRGFLCGCSSDQGGFRGGCLTKCVFLSRVNTTVSWDYTMIAIIRTGGKQYRALEGERLRVETRGRGGRYDHFL